MKLVLLDTSVEFTTVYDHGPNGEDIPYSHAIALDRPVLTYNYKDLDGTAVQGEFKEVGFNVERQGVGLRRGGHFVAVAFQRDLYGVRARFEEESILRHAGEDGVARRVFHGVDGRVVVQARVRIVKGDEAGQVNGTAIAHDMRALVLLDSPALLRALDDLPGAL